MRRPSIDSFLALAITAPVLAWSTWIAQGKVFPSLATSDTVWLLLLAEDLFDRGGRLVAWDLSTHTNFFPELLLVEASRRASASLQDFFFVYSLLSVAALFAASCFCLWLYLRAAGVRSNGEDGSRGGTLALAVLGAFAVNGGWLLLFNWGIFRRPFGLTFMPAFHFWAFALSLFIAFLAIDRFDRTLSRGTIFRLAIAVLLLLATGLSDKITVLDTVPGLVVAAAHYARRLRRIPPGVAAGALVLPAVGALTLLGGDAFWNAVARVKPYPIAVDAAGIPDGIAMFWQALVAGPWHRELLQGTLAVASVASVLLLLGRLLWRRSLDASAQSAPSPTIVKAESMQVFLLASAVLVPLAVLVLGRFENESSLRFVIPAFYCPALAIVAHVLERLAPRASRARLALALAGLGALFSLVPVRTDRAPFRRYFATPLMECLERWSDHYSLDRGLGFHWESHLNTVASGGRLIVRSIAGDGHMFRWANTIDFYSPEATTEPFTFLAVSERLDREGLTRRFGRPERILHCSATKGRWSGHARKGIDVWVYDGDGAKRLTEEMRRQYARARAAPRRSYPRKR